MAWSTQNIWKIPTLRITYHNVFLMRSSSSRRRKKMCLEKLTNAEGWKHICFWLLLCILKVRSDERPTECGCVIFCPLSWNCNASVFISDMFTHFLYVTSLNNVGHLWFALMKVDKKKACKHWRWLPVKLSGHFLFTLQQEMNMKNINLLQCYITPHRQ